MSKKWKTSEEARTSWSNIVEEKGNQTELGMIRTSLGDVYKVRFSHTGEVLYTWNTLADDFRHGYHFLPAEKIAWLKLTGDWEEI